MGSAPRPARMTGPWPREWQDTDDAGERDPDRHMLDLAGGTIGLGAACPSR
jgi:hypothetical protein